MPITRAYCSCRLIVPIAHACQPCLPAMPVEPSSLVRLDQSGVHRCHLDDEAQWDTIACTMACTVPWPVQRALTTTCAGAIVTHSTSPYACHDVQYPYIYTTRMHASTVMAFTHQLNCVSPLHYVTTRHQDFTPHFCRPYRPACIFSVLLSLVSFL